MPAMQPLSRTLMRQKCECYVRERDSEREGSEEMGERGEMGGERRERTEKTGKESLGEEGEKTCVPQTDVPQPLNSGYTTASFTNLVASK